MKLVNRNSAKRNKLSPMMRQILPVNWKRPVTYIIIEDRIIFNQLKEN